MSLYCELEATADLCRHLEIRRPEFEQLPAELAEGLLIVHAERRASLQT